MTLVNSIEHFDCHACYGYGQVEVCDASTDALLYYVPCDCPRIPFWKHTERWSKFPSVLNDLPF